MEFNCVYNANCDELMRDMVEEGILVDLILTDPPYNLHKDFGNDSDCLSLDEFISVTKKRIDLCKQLLTPTGSLIWFGIHNYIGFVQVIMYEAGLFYRRMNIWRYNNGFSRSLKAPATQYEPFLWYSKSNKKWTYNIDDVRVPYLSQKRLETPVYYTNSKGEKKEWKANPKGANRGDVWEFPTLSGKRFSKEKTPHPTQKPEALIMEIIKAFCPKNSEGKYDGVILDPFHGSGTLGVCCEKLNRLGHNIRWIGIEIEKEWCDVAEKRLNEITIQYTIDDTFSKSRL